MKIGILGPRQSWHTEELQKALAKRSITSDRFPATCFIAGISHKPHVRVADQILEEYDAIIVRSIPTGSLEQVIFRVDVLHRLENIGVKIINSATSVERTVDKYYTSTLLEDEGIPTPRTLVTERFDKAMEAFQELGDVTVKPLFGCQGRGIVRVCDEDTAHRVFKSLELGHYVYYLQEYIPHANWDIRAFVIGDDVVAAMVRRADGWKTNVARNARVEPLELNDELKQLSLRASRALGTDYAGVDILKAEKGGYYVIEINSIPAWEGLQKTTELDIADRLIEHVVKIVG